MADCPSDPMREIETLIRRRVVVDHEFSQLVSALGRWLTALTTAENSATAPIIEPKVAVIEVQHDELGAAVALGAAVVLGAPITLGAVLTPAAPAATNGDLVKLCSKFDGVVSPRLIATPLAHTVKIAVAAPPHDHFTALKLIMLRMKLKSDACAWAKRRDLLGLDAVKPHRDQLLARVEPLRPCLLWMVHKPCAFSKNSSWQHLSENFAATAHVLELICEFSSEFDSRHALLELACEAQYALRHAIGMSGALKVGDDIDQVALFKWCCTEGKRLHHFDEFLDGNSKLAPSTPAELSHNLVALKGALQCKARQRKCLASAVGTIKYQLGQIAKDPANALAHWNKIADAIDALRNCGVAASEPSIVELLADDELLESLPHEVATRHNMAEVLGYVDRKVAATERETSAPAQRAPCAEVLRVRAALKGKRLVLIGGDERPHARAAIENAFALGELDWVATKPHNSLDHFTTAIEHSDTTAVILMIRWASHYYTELQHLCDRLGRPFIRLPAGYGANRIAHEIIEQAAERLGIR